MNGRCSKRSLKAAETEGNERIAAAFGELITEIEDVLRQES